MYAFMRCTLLMFLTIPAFLSNGQTRPFPTVMRVPAPPFPYVLKQPNGIEFNARMYGDEYENHIATLSGYFIIDVLEEYHDIWWYYALINENGKLVPSDSLVGISECPPETIGLQSSMDMVRSKRALFKEHDSKINVALRKDSSVPPPPVLKPVVFLVDFPGTLPGQMPSNVYKRNQFAELFFADKLDPTSINPPFPGTYTMSMYDYYQEVSRKQFSVIGNINSVVDWVTAQNSYSYYVDGNQGFGGGPNGMARSLYAVCVEIAQIVDSNVDFSNFDADNDGFVDVVILVMEGWENGAQNLFYPCKTVLVNVPQIDPNAPANASGYLMLDGVIFKNIVVVTEQIYFNQPDCNQGDIYPISVTCHELGHAIGLPDLYDLGPFPTSSGIGDWGLMSYGVWNRLTSPSYPCAWSRDRLNWITPQLLSGLNNESITIEPAELSNRTAAYKLLIDPDNGGEYLLIENRQAIGSDRYIKGTGLLIWHIDENFTDMFPGANFVNQFESTFGVNLMQADNQGHLYSDIYSILTNTGDSGDPFPGSTGNKSFTDATSPGAMSYTYDRDADGIVESASPSGVEITNISQSGNNIQAVVTCPPSTGYKMAYDEGDWENWPWAWGNNLAGIVIKPISTATLKSVQTVFTPTTPTDQLTGYTIRIWDGFNKTGGLPGMLIHTQSGVVNWSASQRNYGWVTIPIRATPSMQCDINKTYYIEIEYMGSGFLMPCDGGIYSRSAASGNSYCRQNLNSPCVQITNGDWNIRVIFSNSITPVTHESWNLPVTFSLKQNYPNPFNLSTTFCFQLPKPTFTTLQVYDILGQVVETIIHGYREAGNYKVTWNSKGFPSGIYLYRIRAGEFVKTRKLILQK